MISTLLWALAILCLYARILIFRRVLKRAGNFFFKDKSITKANLEHFGNDLFIINRILKESDSFQTNIDSKFIGLIIFLNSNMLTGVFNMVFSSSSFSTLGSLLIISLHGFISIGSGCFIQDYFTRIKNKKLIQNDRNLLESDSII